MKQIFILCLAVLAFAGCQDKKNKQWDADAMVSIRPESGVKASQTNSKHLTALEVVKQASGISFWYKKGNPNNPTSRSFGPSNSGYRDTVNQRLLMNGSDIISQFGNYVPDFIEGEDIVIGRELKVANTYDTIAYMKNSVLRAAEKVIKEAYANGDYDIVYAEFDKAFTFIPITGAEWRELKARGEN